MFTVYKKADEYCENPINVYDVRDDKNGYPHFWIYNSVDSYLDDNELSYRNQKGVWKYISAKYYKEFQVEGSI